MITLQDKSQITDLRAYTHWPFSDVIGPLVGWDGGRLQTRPNIEAELLERRMSVVISRI